MSNYVEQLQEVKKLLTKDTWNKSYYFSEKNGIFCFCPHGAAQVISNPEVKKIISEYNTISAAVRLAVGAGRRPADVGRTALVAAATLGAATARSADASAAHGSARETADHLINFWDKREDWIKKDFYYHNKNYGNLDLHYLMGMAGLTVSFADHPDTTLEMIYDKLDEAIEFAKIIDQYNNTKNNNRVNKEIYYLLKFNNLLSQGSKELQEWAKNFEEQEKEDLKKQALAKLTPEEIKALGINT